MIESANYGCQPVEACRESPKASQKIPRPLGRGILFAWNARGQMPARSPSRILFVRTDRLGETILNIPAIATLKAAFPQAFLAVLVRSELAPLLADVPGVDAVLASPKKVSPWWWLRAARLSRLLKVWRFDAAIISNPKKELHLAAWLAGIPTRIGYNRKWGMLLTHRVQDRKAGGDRHEVECNLDLARALGCASLVPPHWIVPHEQERAEAAELLRREGLNPQEAFIVVHPWTSNPIKQWPLERFRELIGMIGRRFAKPVVVIGGAEETGRVASLLPLAECGRVINLVGRLTLCQLAAVLQQGGVLVSNDSGPAHLAAAVGASAVVLFGTTTSGTGPRRWGPWGDRHVMIHRPTMAEIAVQEVVDALESMICV